MEYEYGFGLLEDRLIRLFHPGPPNFEAARELLSCGADLNAVSQNESGENILSEILQQYWYDEEEEPFPRDMDWRGSDGQTPSGERPNLGASMVQIVKFFLENGFDVHKNGGQFGAQCLWSLVLSSASRYMLAAAKLLFDAGARNLPIEDGDPNETPWSFVNVESSFQSCEGNYHSSNIFEAFSQMFQALEEGRPYSGIDSYEAAKGKKVLNVLAGKPRTGDVFYNLALPHSKHKRCFHQNLYFLLEGGCLILDQYVSIWADAALPREELVEISEYFPGVVGSTIEDFTFGRREVVKEHICCGQPIVTLKMDSGVRAVFSMNFGEVEEKDRAAFFSLHGPIGDFQHRSPPSVLSFLRRFWEKGLKE